MAALAFFLLAGPIRQPQEYHAFADGRRILGIDNFWNVVTNLPMMAVAAWGLVVVRRQNSVLSDGESLPLSFFLVGVFLSGAGSCYYHLSPDDARLFWDRLPMTIAFMGLFATFLGQFISPDAGKKALLPLLTVGVASALWWRETGDLRPYVLVQFLPVAITGALLLRGVPARCGTQGILMIFFAYGLAKVCEFADAGLLAMGRLLSGHSLKHLLAAYAVWIAHRTFPRGATSRLRPVPSSDNEGRGS